MSWFDFLLDILWKVFILNGLNLIFFLITQETECSFLGMSKPWTKRLKIVI